MFVESQIYFLIVVLILCLILGRGWRKCFLKARELEQQQTKMLKDFKTVVNQCDDAVKRAESAEAGRTRSENRAKAAEIERDNLVQHTKDIEEQLKSTHKQMQDYETKWRKEFHRANTAEERLEKSWKFPDAKTAMLRVQIADRDTEEARGELDNAKSEWSWKYENINLKGIQNHLNEIFERFDRLTERSMADLPEDIHIQVGNNLIRSYLRSAISTLDQIESGNRQLYFDNIGEPSEKRELYKMLNDKDVSYAVLQQFMEGVNASKEEEYASRWKQKAQFWLAENQRIEKIVDDLRDKLSNANQKAYSYYTLYEAECVKHNKVLEERDFARQERDNYYQETERLRLEFHKEAQERRAVYNPLAELPPERKKVVRALTLKIMHPDKIRALLDGKTSEEVSAYEGVYQFVKETLETD